jgi:3',5'-cyclic AMP phosphodiesterase CpdA
MRKKYPNKFIGLLFLFALVGGCDNPFSFSPFEARVPGELRNTTEKNLRMIEAIENSNDSIFSVALLSDTHYHFDNLRDAVKDINARNDIAFIIVTGDISENGLQKEFELFHRIMAGSNRPYLTVIGNHDYLSNGAEVYRQIFGPFNYSFTFHHVKFVMWDNVLWESNKYPDWEWLVKALSEPGGEKEGGSSYHHIIPFSHIPPFDGQLLADAADFHELLKANKVTVSIHGHKHAYSDNELYGDGIRYVTVGSPQKRAYAILTITPSTASVRKIAY